MARLPYTYEYYESEIRKLYPTIQLLKAYCEANPEDESTLKELEQKERSMSYLKKMWASRIPITAQVASNEGLENSADELRCQTEPMKQYDPKKWPYKQVGDYNAHIPSLGVWYPVCRERKTLEDLYGTLMDRDHRKNLYEEFERFRGHNFTHKVLSAGPGFKIISSSFLIRSSSLSFILLGVSSSGYSSGSSKDSI